MPHSTITHRIAINGTDIDVAPLEIVDFDRLTHKEPDEVKKLLNACQTTGFFQLDLRNGSMSSVPTALEDVYEVAEKFFSQPHELKMKDYRETQERGYKPGEDDETFEISDDETRQGTLVLPSILSEHSHLLKQFARNGGIISKTLLSCLSDALDLGTAGRLKDHHRDDKPSDSGLKMYYEPAKSKLADVKDNEHTDSGTLTLFFYKQWNIQLQLPGTQQWAFIEPKPGHVLVNVANSLQSLTGKRFHSCLHRVTQPHDGFEKRYFVAYFLRPDYALNL